MFRGAGGSVGGGATCRKGDAKKEDRAVGCGGRVTCGDIAEGHIQEGISCEKTLPQRRKEGGDVRREHPMTREKEN